MVLIKNENKIFVPEYLNGEFFANTLEEGLRESQVQIHEINFEWGSNPGDNYCSSIYRVLVTYERVAAGITQSEREQLSLIVKTIPVSPETQFLEDVGVFMKEKTSYFDVLPRLEILANGEKFGAKCYYTQKEPVKTIVFNDLKVDGYTVASRQNGLNWDHSCLILQKLAKFHATSMVLAKKDPAIAKHFTKGMLSPETVLMSETFTQMFGSSLGQLVGLTGKWDGYEKITAKLQYYFDNFKDIFSKVALPKQGDKFTVLNHGDLWTNNFMFAYNDDKPTSAIFVDFQLSFYGSPGCDINFFLNTSVQLDVLRSRRDELIVAYYDSFVETLQYLRFEAIPTLDDLKSELRLRELYGLFALFGFLPMVTMPKDLSEDSSIETMANEEFKRAKFEKVFANENLQAHFRYNLQRLDGLGFFEEI